MVGREEAVVALFARLQSTKAFVTATRRNRPGKSFQPAETPALVLVETDDPYEQPSPSQPVRSMLLTAAMTVSTGTDENVVPGTIFNGVLDAVDAALAPDDISGRCTLGGLVFVAQVEPGNHPRGADGLTGINVSIMRIRIILES